MSVHPHMYVYSPVWSGTSSFDLGTLIPLRLRANTGLGLGCTDNAPIKVPTEPGLRERKYVKEISVPALVSILSPLSQVVIVPLCSPILSVWLSMALQEKKFLLQSIFAWLLSAHGWNKESSDFCEGSIFTCLFPHFLCFLSQRKKSPPTHTHTCTESHFYSTKKKCYAHLPIGFTIW